MARKNKFAEMESGLLDMLNSGEVTSEYTKEFIKEQEIQAEEDKKNVIYYCSPDKFKPYEDAKLRLNLHEGDERDRLKESIKKNGIMQPIICTKDLMIISGHNRVDIAKELGMDVPYIIKDNLTKEEMDLICIDTNLLNRQRNDYLPTQFAYILKVKFDAEKHQGLALGNEFTKYTGDKIGEEYGLSRRMIYTYIKLNDLVAKGKVLVDEKKISIKTAYELSCFEQDMQEILVKYFEEYKINDKILKEIKINLEGRNLIAQDEKLTFIESQLFRLCKSSGGKHKIDYRHIRKYLPDYIKEEDVEDYLIKALKAYQEQNIED